MSLALLVALASSCLHGAPAPEQIRQGGEPEHGLPAQFAATANTGDVQAGWLRSFGSPQLEALVDEALRHNPDLSKAAAQVEGAKAHLALAGAALWPELNAAGRFTTKLGDSLDSGLSGILGVLSWEIDVWGRVRSARDAARDGYQAAKYEESYARLSVAAAVAQAWFLVIEARGQTSIASASVDSARNLLALAEQKSRIGSRPASDVFRASAQVASAEDRLEQVRSAELEARRALEVLLGRYPAGSIETAPALPEVPPPAPAGLPLGVLERRPDVLAAERRVAMAFHLTDEARAARLPRLSLAASLGAIRSQLLVLKSFSNPIGGVGAKLLAPVFDGGKLAAQVDIKTAEQKVAVAEYASVVLRALDEVERSLGTSATLEKREPLLQRVLLDNRKALELAQTEYEVGKSDFSTVLQQKLAVDAAESDVLKLHAQQLAERVTLHLSLGGSFQ
jgi:NodT family efflux transporter outer membrane factor (OMF) lipoprotein